MFSALTPYIAAPEDCVATETTLQLHLPVMTVPMGQSRSGTELAVENIYEFSIH